MQVRAKIKSQFVPVSTQMQRLVKQTAGMSIAQGLDQCVGELNLVATTEQELKLLCELYRCLIYGGRIDVMDRHGEQLGWVQAGADEVGRTGGEAVARPPDPGDHDLGPLDS